MNRLKRAGYLGDDFKNFSEMCEADVGLFKAVTSNFDHVMYQMLPPIKNTPYHLRPRAHNFELPVVNNNLRKNFIYRMLYSTSYSSHIMHPINFFFFFRFFDLLTFYVV